MKGKHEWIKDKDELDALFCVVEENLDLIPQKPEKTKTRLGFQYYDADNELDHEPGENRSPLDV